MFCCGQSITLTEEQKKQIRLQREIHLIELYGLNNNQDFELLDIPIKVGELTYYVHVFSAGPIDKVLDNSLQPLLLLLHGYGGSHIHYARMYPHLIQNFRVFSIDLPGMGLSSKDNIDMTDKHTASEFFMSVLLGVVQFALNTHSINEKCVLVGHSFGGFLATKLFVRYPQYFSQFILLSPAGFTFYNEEQYQSLQRLEHYSGFRKFLVGNFQIRAFQARITPKKLQTYWLGRQALKTYLSRRMGLKDLEYTIWKNYIDSMLELPDGSEESIFILLNWPDAVALGVDSSEYLLRTNLQQIAHIPIRIYYGDQDWMNQDGAHRISTESHIKIRIIPQAGHQLNFENPARVAQCICEDYQQLNMDIRYKQEISE